MGVATAGRHNQNSMKVINDCIYGMVAVPPYAEAVMATPLFQRLGRVKQLGCLHLVWPSAVHTRMEHSIGTMHLAIEYARLLDMADRDARAFVLASLLHDIAHGPFSHTFEKVAGAHFDHDVFRHRLLHDVGLDADMREGVAAVWSGDARGPWRNAVVLHQLLAGTAGVDRMDYLVRDSYHTTPQCRLDKTCVQSIMLHTRVQWDAQQVRYTAKGSKFICHLLEARQYMYREVYLHPRAMAGEKLLVRAFQEGLLREILPYLTPSLFERVDDAWVTSRAWNDGAPYAATLRKYLRGDVGRRTVSPARAGSPCTDAVVCTRADGSLVSVQGFWRELEREKSFI